MWFDVLAFLIVAAVLTIQIVLVKFAYYLGYRHGVEDSGLTWRERVNRVK